MWQCAVVGGSRQQVVKLVVAGTVVGTAEIQVVVAGGSIPESR